ncbi:MAG TPA: response regulator, partial [Lacipirellulaceae bacterium]|nr:response regulator [Lacipirellulaceae bacterium]
AESYSAANTLDERLRAISLLQQKARSLDAEVDRRHRVERVLAARERELADLIDKTIEGGSAGGQSDATAPAQKTIITKHRILVADDNRDAGRTMCMLLRAKGYDVRIARDGEEALATAEEFLPNAILMDVSMPKLNGYEATRRLRAMPLGKTMTIIALTGWGQPSDVAKSIEAGCTAHLVKPVDFAELDRLLSRAVDGQA